MIFRWLRARRRKKILASAMPGDLPEIVRFAIRYFDSWPPELRDKALADIRIFVAETSWEGCDGLVMTDEVRFVIAAQAAMMLTGIRDYVFDGVKTVLVYPGSFKRTMQHGLVVSDNTLSGQAWLRGPIVLSWPDVAESWYGHNVVVHELAHHLDGIDGDMSGVPVFDTADSQDEWERVSSAELARLERALTHGHGSVLDGYGATSRAEFFAVACEAFFETPVPLKQYHAELYDCLKAYFHADPARWLESSTV